MDRAINDFENVLNKGKDTIAIAFINFNYDLNETLGESKQWLENLKILMEKGKKLIIMNLNNNIFEGFNIKETEVTVDMWREIKFKKTISKHPENECVSIEKFNKVLKRVEILEKLIKANTIQLQRLRRKKRVMCGKNSRR